MLNLKILNEKENKLLDRKELEVEAIYDGPTPKKIELTKEISNLSKAKENLIKIKKIRQSFGATRAYISLYVYNTEESLKSIEPHERKKKEAPPKQPQAEKKEAKTKGSAEEKKKES